MTKVKQFVLVLTIITISINYGQDKSISKLDSSKTSNSVNSTQAEEGDVNFSDGTNTLLRITDEGNFGAIEFKAGVPSSTTNKLYNDNGTLKFSGSSLGGGTNDINNLSDAKSDNSNVFIGYNAGKSGITGPHNSSLGFYSLNSITTGNENTAIGSWALKNNIDGHWNTAVGRRALELNTASDNTALGAFALSFTTTGFSNTGIGDRALYSNTIGKFNVAVGASSNFYNEEGSQNTVLGHQAGSGSSLHNKSGNVFIGYRAGYNEIGDNKLYIENSNSASPLIWGDFLNDDVQINGNLHVTGNITSDGASINLAIGDSYQGGIIFWLDETGKHGLIAATSDQSGGMNWSSNSSTSTGASGDGIGAGLMNSLLIITENRTGTSAAKVCTDLAVTVGSIVYGNWYMPSLHELQLLFAQKNLIGGFTNHFYWSSKEAGATAARVVNFVSGSATSSYSKSLTSIKVRAIRNF